MEKFWITKRYLKNIIMKVNIGKRVADVELLSKNGNFVVISIDGEEYEVDIAMLKDGVYSILKKGRSYKAELIRSEDGKNYEVNTAFSSHKVQILDSKAKYLRLKSGADERQDDKIVTPMPGKVVNIPIKVGQQLKAGETVVVIEAMKMQNNYKVSDDCVVKEILISEGDAVKSDQLLVRLDLVNNN